MYAIDREHVVKSVNTSVNKKFKDPCRSLNRSNAVLGILSISKGGISGTVTDVRLIFQGALKTNASGIIVCHNHPSGNANPSESDRKITQKIKEAGNLMDIQLLDHIIILPVEGYYSFADDGEV